MLRALLRFGCHDDVVHEDAVVMSFTSLAIRRCSWSCSWCSLSGSQWFGCRDDVVCLKMMPVDVDGDDDVDGLDGDALHGRTDEGGAFADDVDDGGEADGDISIRHITTT